jgi:hypothetical protein
MPNYSLRLIRTAVRAADQPSVTPAEPKWMSGVRRQAGVAEPFASDPRFWGAMASSADAAAALVLAIAGAILLALSVGGLWTMLPFALPLAFLARAALHGVASARSSRAAFGADGRKGWRDAERHAVARAFLPVLCRPRLRARS